MRTRIRWSLCLISVLAVSCSGLSPLEAESTETVKIESVSLPGALWDPFMPAISEGEKATIDGRLTIPATDEPVPAVIITHGCGGIGGAERGWVDDFVDAGYAVLLLDSFGGRGISSICFGRETVNVASIIVDVYRAAEVLDDHQYIDGDRLAIMGLSFGGRTAVWSAMDRFQETYGGEPLQAHVAFYPSTCFIRLQDEHLTSGPIRIFHGTEDDWTPIDQCETFVDRMSAAGADIALFPFEGARHSFDNETLDNASYSRINALSPRECDFVETDGDIIDSDTGRVAGVGSVCVRLGVTYGYNAQAHQEAKTKLLEFLAEQFASDTNQQ